MDPAIGVISNYSRKHNGVSRKRLTESKSGKSVVDNGGHSFFPPDAVCLSTIREITALAKTQWQLGIERISAPHQTTGSNKTWLVNSQPGFGEDQYPTFRSHLLNRKVVHATKYAYLSSPHSRERGSALVHRRKPRSRRCTGERGNRHQALRHGFCPNVWTKKNPRKMSKRLDISEIHHAQLTIYYTTSTNICQPLADTFEDIRDTIRQII